MTTPLKQGDYPIRKRVTIADAPGLRVRELHLDADQCVPWHFHTSITDTFFCMEGPLVVETRAPDGAPGPTHVLDEGGTVAVPPGHAHYVHGQDGPCRFMIVQGVGDYDYVPAGD